MDRRHFLKAAVAAPAIAASTGPLILGAEDKAGSQLPRVGTGEHTYESHHGWGELPTHLEWQTTHNVAVDAEGLIYVTQQGLGKNRIDTVLVFEPSGKFVRSFGEQWWGGGHGLDIRREGNEEVLYLTNTWKNPKVVKATLKGEIVWVKERPECPEYEDPKTPYSPTNIAFLPDGGFVIGDGYGSHFMLIFDRDAKLTKTFGGKGKEDGRFQTPHGHWLDSRDPANPKLVVCDRANARLQTFTPDGEFLSATTPKEVVLFPANIDTRGDVMLVPDLHARITLLGKDGRVLTHLGEDPDWRKKVVDSLSTKNKVRETPSEWQPGKFVHPHDACFDRDGNIYVAEWVSTGRVTFLKKVG